MKNAEAEIKAILFHGSTFAWLVWRKNSYFTALTIHIAIFRKR